MPSDRGFFAGSRIAKKEPTKGIARCGACGLSKTCDTPKMPVEGNGGRGILFVGEAPGEREDERGSLLEGRSWQRLQRTLRRLRFDLEDDGWLTNALICRPRSDKKRTTAEVAHCRPNLARAIRELNPTVIIPMGALGVSGVLAPLWKEETGQMERWAGWQIPSQVHNTWVCPTWSAAQVAREDDAVLERQFESHIAKAVELTSRPWPSGAPKWADNVVRELDPIKAAAWLRRCGSFDTGAIAWDYETNCLKPDGPDARIVSCSVAWGRDEPETVMAFPWQGEAITAMGELLRSPIPKIASNLKFEDRWTRKEFGHRVRNWVWDTMLAAHVLDNRPGITSVKFQAFVRLGTPVWNSKIEPFLKTKGDDRINAILHEIDMRDLLIYNGLDADQEFRVAIHQINEMGYGIPWHV